MDVVYYVKNENGNRRMTINAGIPINTIRDDLISIYNSDRQTKFILCDLSEGCDKSLIYQIFPEDDPVEITKRPPLSYWISKHTTDQNITNTINKTTQDTIFNEKQPFNSVGKDYSGIFENESIIVSVVAEKENSLMDTVPASVNPVYAIRISALDKSIDEDGFRIKPLWVSRSEENLYRYNCVEYMTRGEVFSGLSKMKSMDFPDTFSRKTSVIQNHSGKWRNRKNEY